MKRKNLHRQIPAFMKPIRLIVSTLAGSMLVGLSQISCAQHALLGYSITPSFASVTISNVLVNGGAITSPVEAASTINVTLDYHIFDDGCPGCVDQIQVGFTHSSPGDCVYNDIPGPSPGVSGTASFTITAPVILALTDHRPLVVQPVGGVAHTTPNRWLATITGNEDSLITICR